MRHQRSPWRAHPRQRRLRQLRRIRSGDPAPAGSGTARRSRRRQARADPARITRLQAFESLAEHARPSPVHRALRERREGRRVRGLEGVFPAGARGGRRLHLIGPEAQSSGFTFGGRHDAPRLHLRNARLESTCSKEDWQMTTDEGLALQPPIAHLSGRRLIDLSDGRATLAIPASHRFRGPKGRIDSGMLAFLADMAHFYAVLSTLPAGAACTTAELSITFLGQPPDAEGELRASSEVVYADERNALAVAFVRDDQGRQVAYSSSRYFIFPAGSFRPRRGADASATGMLSSLPDPVSRTCESAFSPLDELALKRVSGLEILKAELAGDRVSPPIDRITGIRLAHADDGHVVFALPAHQWLRQENGTVFGGAIALLAKSATAGAVQAAAGAGTGFRALDLKVNFLRPVDADGTELRAEGKVRHLGRRLVIADTTVTHGGRTVASATGTTALTAPPSHERSLQ